MVTPTRLNRDNHIVLSDGPITIIINRSGRETDNVIAARAVFTSKQQQDNDNALIAMTEGKGAQSISPMEARERNMTDAPFGVKKDGTPAKKRGRKAGFKVAKEGGEAATPSIPPPSAIAKASVAPPPAKQKETTSSKQ